MRDRTFILAATVAFVALATSPSWYAVAAGTRGAMPRLARPRAATPCVLPPAEMRASHMTLLVEWRDLAVRRGVRTVTMPDGRTWGVSLTRTCLGCHDDKAGFCDRCHDYAAVSPECWNCHAVQGAMQGSGRAQRGGRP